jgi:hypothetical protein
MKKILLVSLVLLATLTLLANVPAPYWPCNGKKAGDACTWSYGCNNTGSCVAVKDCTDNPQTPVNECLICQTR